MGVFAKKLDRDEVVARVNGLPCFGCGVPSRSGEIVTQRAALSGSVVQFGVCANCRTDELDRLTVAELLDLDPADPALGAVKVQRYADVLPCPTVAASDAWGHVDLGVLTQRVIEARAEREARTGEPCSYCGLSVLPEDLEELGWAAVDRRHACWSCADWFADAVGDEQRRGVVAGWVAGYATSPTRRKVLGLRQLNDMIVFWHELPADEREPGQEHPWAHLDIDGIVRTCEERWVGGGLSASQWRRAAEVRSRRRVW